MAQFIVVKVEDDCDIADAAGPGVVNTSIVRTVTVLDGDNQVEIKQAVKAGKQLGLDTRRLRGT